MIYTEISGKDYYRLRNTTGAYLVLWSNGTKEWYLHGNFHREDGPAIEGANGTKQWYLHGERHREDGPTVELADGDKFWHLDGFLHREDGPAVEWADGAEEWWLHEIQYQTEEEWQIALEELKKKEIKDLIV